MPKSTVRQGREYSAAAAAASAMRSRPTRAGSVTAKVRPVSSSWLTTSAFRPVRRWQASASVAVSPGTTLHTMTPSQLTGSTPRRSSKKRSSAAYSSRVQRGRVTMRVVKRTVRPSSPPMQMLELPMSTASTIVCPHIVVLTHYTT